MSGIVSGIDYTQLFGTSASSAADNMLSIIYGNGTTASGSTAVSTGDPITDLKLAQANETQDVKQQASSPTVVRDIAAFTKAIAGATSITSALQNPDVLKVLLTANGMADQIAYPALAEKALMSNPSDTSSLANQLGDTRWQGLVSDYNFYSNGLAELQNPTVQAQITQAYAQVTWMNSLDAATPGLSDALEFKKQASQITSVDQILGDPVNRAVVLTALGIPQQVAFQDITAQEQAVSSRLDISKLQDPTFVNSLTDQYLLNMQQQNQGSTSSTSIEALAVQANGLIA